MLLRAVGELDIAVRTLYRFPMTSTNPDSQSNQPIRVANVEDDRGLRDGLGMLINGTPGFSCSGSYRSVEEALDRIQFDVQAIVLSDIGLPEEVLPEATRLVADALPDQSPDDLERLLHAAWRGDMPATLVTTS